MQASDPLVHAASPSPGQQLWAALRPTLAVAGFFSLFINLMMLGPILYMLQVYDRVLASRSLPTLAMLTLAVVVSIAALVLVDMARSRLLVLAARRIDELLGQRVLRQVLRHASSLGRAGPLNGLREVATLRGFLTGSNVLALFDAPWLLVFIGILFLFHAWMGAIAVAGSALLVLLAWLNERVNRSELERYQDATRRGTQAIEQGIRNADVLNSMGMADRFAARWHALNTEALERMQASSERGSAILAASKFVRQAIQVVMMAMGAYLVIHDHLSAGVMIAATVLLGRAMAPVESLIGNWNGLVAARLAYRRLASTYPGLFDERSRQELPDPQGRVQVENVFLAGHSREHPILRNVDFLLPAGRSLAIIGPSGSGKSSLAKLVAGVWLPASGHVRIDGADLRHWNENRLGRWLGYLPQDVELFSGTVAENIGRFDASDARAIVDAAQAAHAYELILRLPEGFETRIGEGGIQLSAGQAQRIGLARALYGGPRLVILDEPNANLDADGELALVQALAGLKARGATVILITHKPSLVGTMDDLLVLREGRIDAYGTRDEILRRLQAANMPAVRTGTGP